jgi:hypothetical protein
METTTTMTTMNNDIEQIISQHGLTAWRSMHCATNEPLLLTGQNFVWLPRHTASAMSNLCTQKARHLPTMTLPFCTCGIYSFKSAMSVFEQGYIGYQPNESASYLSYLVKLYVSGRVVRHSHGYRSQYATIAEIVVLYDTNEQEFDALERACALEQSYGVPTTSRTLTLDERAWSTRTYAQSPPSTQLTFGELWSAYHKKDLKPDLHSYVVRQLRQRLKGKIGRLEKRIQNMRQTVYALQAQLEDERARLQTIK